MEPVSNNNNYIINNKLVKLIKGVHSLMELASNNNYYIIINIL